MSLFHAGICFSQSLRYRCCWIQCKHSTSMGSSFSGLSENSACNRTLRPAYRHPVVIPGQSEQVIWVRAPQILGKEQCILVEPLEGLSTVAVARSLGTVCRDRVPIEVRNRNHFFFILLYEVMRPLLYSLLKTLTFRNLLKLLLSKTGQVLLKLVSTNY